MQFYKEPSRTISLSKKIRIGHFGYWPIQWIINNINVCLIKVTRDEYFKWNGTILKLEVECRSQSANEQHCILMKFYSTDIKPGVRLKAVFHFNRIVAKRSVFHCFVITRIELMTCTQWNTLRFATIRLKWKTVRTLYEWLWLKGMHER